MAENMHLVEYEVYCASCEHAESDPAEDPCDECLGVPARENTRKPINYKEKEK